MDHMVYLDNAATTQCAKEALDAMLPYFTEQYGNASSIYQLGAQSKKAITNARDIIAKSLNTDGAEIYFTAGGSESDNWALIATAEAYAKKESISSHPGSNIMRFSIPVSIWKREAMK